jgi:hypothetical protein
VEAFRQAIEFSGTSDTFYQQGSAPICSKQRLDLNDNLLGAILPSLCHRAPLGQIPQDLCPLTVCAPRSVHSKLPQNKTKERANRKNLPKAKRSASFNRSLRAFGSHLAERRILRAGAFVKVRPSFIAPRTAEIPLSNSAREHDLSPYTSICRSCGLILCTINLPYYACPHCSEMLLSDIARSSLATRLEEEISKKITKEEEERERVVQEAREADGAFPVLLSSGISPASPNVPFRPSSQTHKVLSLNSKTKKYTVSSYTNTPVSSRPASRAESEEEVHRVAAPSQEVDYVRSTPDRHHPWSNMRLQDLYYVPPP